MINMTNPAADRITPARAAQSTSPPSATEAVFESILADILRGVFPPGARLPPERDLSRQLGASRPTLREALRRLSEWQLIEARRGSGVVVMPQRDWSIEVLPAYLRYASPGPDQPTIGRLLIDLLALRRVLLVEVVRIVADRIPRGGTAGPRAAAARAREVRDQPTRFPVVDFAVMRGIAESAKFLPAVWLLNRLSGVYLEIAVSLTSSIRPPDTYLDAHYQLFDALERNDAEQSARILGKYLDEHDNALITALGPLS